MHKATSSLRSQYVLGLRRFCSLYHSDPEPGDGAKLDQVSVEAFDVYVSRNESTVQLRPDLGPAEVEEYTTFDGVCAFAEVNAQVELALSKWTGQPGMYDADTGMGDMTCLMGVEEIVK